jgi:hypothetical protein
MGENTGNSIALDSARLFRVHTTLAVLPGANIAFLNPVEVRAAARRLGWCAITVRGDEVLGDLVFSYSSPERLSIETRAEKLYARLEGVWELDADPWEHVGGLDGLAPGQRQHISAVQILSVNISRQPSYEGQPSLDEVVL